MRLPPNQSLVAPGRWPLVGESAPRVDDAPWTVTMDGCVSQPTTWTLDDLRTLPLVEITLDIHCVTRWSRFDVPFRGVPLTTLLDACAPTADARYISFVARTDRGHSSSLVLADAIDLNVLVALDADGAPLTTDHGGPVRIVTPGRYFYKSVKWLERIELLSEDRLGYWEEDAGYHNHADPWQEQRYMAANLNRATVARVLAERDFSGLDLRSISAVDRDLKTLNATDAHLRDADFRRAQLTEANFARANCSNAHFGGAQLDRAVFTETDVEGADFSGASLRHADFTGASLFGTTFAAEVNGSCERGALIDATTRFSAASLESLTPLQHAYLMSCAPTLI